MKINRFRETSVDEPCGDLEVFSLFVGCEFNQAQNPACGQ